MQRAKLPKKALELLKTNASRWYLLVSLGLVGVSILSFQNCAGLKAVSGTSLTDKTNSMGAKGLVSENLSSEQLKACQTQSDRIQYKTIVSATNGFTQNETLTGFTTSCGGLCGTGFHVEISDQKGPYCVPDSVPREHSFMEAAYYNLNDTQVGQCIVTGTGTAFSQSGIHTLTKFGCFAKCNSLLNPSSLLHTTCTFEQQTLTQDFQALLGTRPASTGAAPSPSSAAAPPPPAASAVCTNPVSDLQYLDMYPDVRQANVHPWLHYKRAGRNEGRCPIIGTCNSNLPAITNEEYIELYDDLPAAGLVTAADARKHYEEFGRNEGRCRLERVIFQPNNYLAANPDVNQWAETAAQNMLASGGGDIDAIKWILAKQHFCRQIVNGSEVRALTPGGAPFHFDAKAWLYAVSFMNGPPPGGIDYSLIKQFQSSNCENTTAWVDWPMR